MDSIRRFGDYELDLALYQLRCRGHVIPLERRVFDLLAYLVANPNRVVSKEELFEHVWEGRAISAGSLSVAIAAIRRALKDDALKPQILVTHRGRGYSLALNVDSFLGPTIPQTQLGGEFVGRERELLALESLLSRSASNQAAFALVAGEPGIGKSRLLEHFASLARSRGARVVFGRCREEYGAPPYWPWIQVVRELCSDKASARAAQGLAVDAPEIAREVPGISSLAELAAGSLPAEHARFRLFDGFVRFIHEACPQETLVILLDDLHRADQDSLLLLASLVSATHPSRLVVVGTYRPVEIGTDRRRLDLLASSIRHASGSTIELQGLSLDEVSALIRSAGGVSPSPEQAAALEDLTGGNPFFLVQLARMINEALPDPRNFVAALPPTVRDAIARQLDGLSLTCRAPLVVGSVIGRQFDRSLVAAALASDEVEVERGLDEAVAAGLVSRVQGEPGSYRFKHVLVREALYQAIDVLDRAQLHLAVGEALHRSTSRRDRIAEVALHHLESIPVGSAERAIELCCEAAARARESVAYAEAVEWYQRALAVAEQDRDIDPKRVCQIALALGADQVRSGDREGAKATFDRAAHLAEDLRVPEMLAEAALGTAPGFFAVEAGVYDDLLVGLLRRAEGALREDQCALKALVLARLGMALFWSGPDGDCSDLSREAWRLAESVSDSRVRLQVLMSRWLGEWSPSGFKARDAISQQAIALARECGDKEMLVMALLFGLVASMEKGDISEFDVRMGEFRRLAEELGQPQARWYADLIAASRDLQSGQFGRAEERAHSYFEIGQRIGDANAVHSRMAQGLVRAAELGSADELLAIAEEGVRQYPVFIGWKAVCCWGLARKQQVEDATERLETTLALAECSRRKLDWPTALVVLAETAFLLKHRAAAERILGLLLPMRGTHLVLGFCVMSWGPVSRYLGLLAEVCGRKVEAARWYEEAIVEGRRSEADPWVAHALLGLARVQASLGARSSEVGENIKRAHGIARRLGMRNLIREIEDIRKTSFRTNS